MRHEPNPRPTRTRLSDVLTTDLVRGLFEIPDVTLVGEGKKRVRGVETGEDAVVVGVTRKTDKHNLSRGMIIPKKVGRLGKRVRTDVVETGLIELKHNTPMTSTPDTNDRTVEWSPAPGGVSIGHKNITAGTFGMLVNKQYSPYVLSNNHVLANGNKADIGDAIYQPGPHDGGTDEQIKARLCEYVPIEPSTYTESNCSIAKFLCKTVNTLTHLLGRKTSIIPVQQEHNENTVDCALGEPVDENMFEYRVLEIGEPSTVVKEAYVDMKVQKSGRTTGLTKGKVTAINATARIYMGGWFAIFVDQIGTTHMVEGGDSGSILFEDDNGKENNNIVGLCFAGSDEISLANRFSNVIDALGLEGYSNG